jgi:glycosyltransferase involved in cell wall biosynthesis
MDVSVVMPLYKPNKEILAKVLKSLKNQKFSGKMEIIYVEKGWGLARSMNYGIKRARYDVIITLHQDCIPSTNNWLTRLIEPLKEDRTVASCSSIYDLENKKEYVPLLDEKGCAYKKSALKKVSYFDERLFLNSGEDMDMYLKLKKIGKIAYPKVSVVHNHPGYLSASGYKRLQNANTWGCLLRKHGFSLPGWWKGLVKANVFNGGYFYWFWRGFLLGKQDFKR